jgi:hypothetical protein
VNLLGDLCRAGKLNPAQAQRFLRQTVRRLRIETRPTLLLGHQCPVVVYHERRLPSRPPHVSVTVTEVRVDGRVVSHPNRRLWESDYPDLRRFRSMLWVDLEEAGKRTLAVDVEVAVYANAMARDRGAAPLHQRIETLAVPVEVLAEAPPRCITFQTSPELDALIASRVSIRRIESRERKGYGAVDGARVEVDFLPGLPVDVALEVLVEVEGKSYFLGTVSASRENPKVQRRVVESKFTPPLPDDVTVLLRATSRAAERTLNMYRIWGGALRYTKACQRSR